MDHAARPHWNRPIRRAARSGQDVPRPGAVGPAGPVDADLSLLSIRSPDRRPIALVANYSMHYFPPPEQHHLGGYSTWEARTAGLEEQAEPDGPEHLFVGGRNDDFANFAGKIGEVALYDRVLTPDEVARHYVS